MNRYRMVWNVLTADFEVDEMGTFDNSLKKMFRFERLKEEIQSWENLLGKLDTKLEHFDENLATHRETGIVYDLRVVRKRIEEINVELKDVEDYIDG